MFRIRPPATTDDINIHLGAIIFNSDRNYLFTVPRVFEYKRPMAQLASLSHWIIIHVPARADEWLVMETQSTRSYAGRATILGKIWRLSDGEMIATVGQEGIAKPTSKMELPKL